MFKTYISLTKPGIIMGNVMTTIAGFLLAWQTHDVRFNLGSFFGVLIGTSLIIASGCVFNNYIDRHIDKKMARTKNRALVSGAISVRHALLFGTILSIVGFSMLALLTNPSTVLVGFIGLFFYVVMYSFWKRRSSLGTVVGSVSGATPVLAGYVAVSNNFDAGAWAVFLILVTWQMPHFYAIAMYRLKDYTAANIPVLPATKGPTITKVQILLYICAFAIACFLLTTLGYTGYTFLTVMSIVSAGWLVLGIKGFNAEKPERWARGMFLFSLTVILILSVMLPLGALLP